MKRWIIINLFYFLLIFYPVFARHGTAVSIVQEINLSNYQIHITKRDSYDVISLSTRQGRADWEMTDEVGRPQVPILPYTVPLPLSAKVSGVKILETCLETLPARYVVFPAQPQVILSKREVLEFSPPSLKVYTSSLPYPGKVIELVGVHRKREGKAAELLLYPIQYLPKEGLLLFYKKIKWELEYEEIDFPVDGEKTVDRFEYLIITSPPLDTIFQRLADWKQMKGIPSSLRTVQWIEANYPGRDRQERIRNYLKTLPDSGVKWVLLGGDVDIIPCRYAYAMTCSAFYHQREDLLPCDLYYSDLDGNWNFDGDTIFGEVGDSIDLYPDLYVGRAPVNTISEAQAFVNKTLTYEKNPPADYIRNVLFFAEVLWSNPYTDAGIHKDKMERESFASDFNITKLYERLGNENREAVMAEIRRGKNLANHDGHGWINLMSTGVGSLNNQDMDTITNPGRFGILYSIGCWTSAFDYDAIAEHYIFNPRGGGIGFIGNSSYGWGSPGNPGFGYSDKFDNRFFYELLKNNRSLGEALAYAKIHYIPFSRQKNVYRWHQYQVNLLGDPEIRVWTKEPCSLTVHSPTSIPRGESRIQFSVSYEGRPVKNALVCLMKDEESYDRGFTDDKGEVFLRAQPQSLGDFSLTVTASNFYPIERRIPVVSGGYVNFEGFLINDSLGNDDE